MRYHRKGIVLTAAVPAAETDIRQFEQALDKLEKYDMRMIEYIAPKKEHAIECGNLLAERNYRSLYITALAQRRSSFCNLCAPDEGVRLKSVDFVRESLDIAMAAGAERSLILSGPYPQNSEHEVRAMDALYQSIDALCTHVGSNIILALEPTDRALDVKQLIGPTLQTVTLVKHLCKTHKNLTTTLDIAHVTELFEDPLLAFNVLQPYCGHVHVANCVLNDSSPLFGDKHPTLDEPLSVYSTERMRELAEAIRDAGGKKEVLFSVEMICRVADGQAFLAQLIQQMEWFFKDF